MDKFQKTTVKSRLLRLARLRSTGTPADLAFRFEISQRSIKRLVKELRDEGKDIKYSPACMSYITEDF